MRRKQPLQLLISSGPTREPIDPVRFLSNYSTGYMGRQLALEALARGHRVTMVSGPTTEIPPAEVRLVSVEQASQMAAALRRHAPTADAVIMAAAVSDFRANHTASRKLSRQSTRLLRLTEVPDIIAHLPRRSRQLRVGFALETDHVVARAQRKLRTKRLDLLLAQDARRSSPFGRRQVYAWLVERGGVMKLGRLSKRRVARALLDKIEALWYGQPHEK